nr:hypothetical protein WG33_0402 [uncultured bacterium]
MACQIGQDGLPGAPHDPEYRECNQERCGAHRSIVRIGDD